MYRCSSVVVGEGAVVRNCRWIVRMGVICKFGIKDQIVIVEEVGMEGREKEERKIRRRKEEREEEKEKSF
jgi:hypothetical protein